MKHILWLLAVCVLSVSCGKKDETKPSSSSTSQGNPVTAPVDYLGAVGKAQQQAVKTIELTSITQAIRLFEAQEDRLPKDLNELVTKKYLPEIPPPPAGQKLDYNPKTGELKMVKQ